MKYLLSLFAESNGTPSSMRVMSAYIIVNTMVAWTYTIVQLGVWIDPSFNMIALIMGALGVKTWQKKYEGVDCVVQNAIKNRTDR